MARGRTVDLTHLDRLDFQSRRQFRNACAAIFIGNYPRKFLREVEARGFEEFLRIAKPIWTHHAFKFEDYKFIFNCIKQANAGKLKARDLLVPGPAH